MILYYTGTGNSRYIARQLASELGDTLVSMNDKLKQQDTQLINVSDRLIFVVPTYAWRIPKIVEQWIEKTEFVGEKKVWFVMNCGSEIGNASKYIQILCQKKHWYYMGTMPILMPENYIVLFHAPSDNEASEIIQKANSYICEAVQLIKTNQKFPKNRHNLYDKLMSGIINPIFYQLIVKANDFYVTEQCIGCGKCENLCPLNNIQLKDHKPIWGHRCTHCMACICCCPKSAIEYGKKSIGKKRYYLENEKLQLIKNREREEFIWRLQLIFIILEKMGMLTNLWKKCYQVVLLMIFVKKKEILGMNIFYQ